MRLQTVKLINLAPQSDRPRQEPSPLPTPSGYFCMVPSAFQDLYPDGPVDK